MNVQSATNLLRENILPFWQGLQDTQHGGFYGEADFFGVPVKNADKGCILNSRILWTFSAAYRALGDRPYLTTATAAYDFLRSSFLDSENSGLYWLVTADGQPTDTKKHFYNIAFGIYALSEYYLATKSEESLALAMELFDKMEAHGRDYLHGGYIEACTRNWQPAEDFRLSDKELNLPKSMNTHLHILEAYTTLLRATNHPRVHEALSAITRITLDKIIHNQRTFLLFFDNNWAPHEAPQSYGHDIEGSWLVHDAAEALGDAEILAEAREAAVKIAASMLQLAVDRENGGLISEPAMQEKEWWPQAEAVVGFYNAYQLSRDEKYKQAAISIWDFTLAHFVDHENGEWHRILLGNKPDISMYKSGFWKCPYHNARMCLELITRLQS
jgi:mannobiose 2-epimerase